MCGKRRSENKWRSAQSIKFSSIRTKISKYKITILYPVIESFTRSYKHNQEVIWELGHYFYIVLSTMRKFAPKGKAKKKKRAAERKERKIENNI